MGDPSAEIEPQHVAGIVHIVLGELASKDLLKIEVEKEK